MSHPPLELLVQRVRSSADIHEWSKDVSRRLCSMPPRHRRALSPLKCSARNSVQYMPMCILPRARGSESLERKLGEKAWSENLAPVPLPTGVVRNMAKAYADQVRLERYHIQSSIASQSRRGVVMSARAAVQGARKELAAADERSLCRQVPESARLLRPPLMQLSSLGPAGLLERSRPRSADSPSKERPDALPPMPPAPRHAVSAPQSSIDGDEF